ncbi:MAG: 2-oxoglutarate dehydrogenase complex dihydrolipoyllysine-residue succinyltransferase [Methylococcales symbiont of Hymedesmia sp. n. MRB-2018]|nr:MAG: 2-oxoglutarate dehydrogenase complex dihydrolipoyllysine-residue succinyltransferase [Methylococcales symbiont of Hymedesmia sp. n. MRB-2018]KAF3983118.1 MAG: 2-oxoglutarate dehydrogenase complex dihydrolipoyllysine-residue succinyltransferase [Methylococcales symbiont of Hymedesmia sp. n. MRB-2018]
MSIEILVPNLPESVSDAILSTWHKQTGDFVNKGENLIDLETDKIVLEVPAPESGILSKILQQEGTTVVGGDVLAILDIKDSAESIASTDPKTIEKANEGIPLSPAVRRLIQEKNIDPQTILGSGKKRRLTKADVLAHIEKNSAQVPSASTQTKPATIKTMTNTSNTILKGNTNFRPEQRVPMTRLRAKVAERLLQAQQNAAMLTTFNEVNMQSVIDLRNQYKDRFLKKHEIKLGFMSFFIKASIEALKKHPPINASIDENDIIYHGYYDMGIAVSTPRGLIVPVIRDADQLDFAGIEKSIFDYGSKARDGALSYEDLTGGTFTITNGGIFGSMLSTPILNPPQCAILGMHTIKERPVVEDGEIVIRPIMYLALSYDHRLVDGKDAVQFLITIKECLESPAHLLLNI